MRLLVANVEFRQNPENPINYFRQLLSKMTNDVMSRLQYLESTILFQITIFYLSECFNSRWTGQLVGLSRNHTLYWYARILHLAKNYVYYRRDFQHQSIHIHGCFLKF